MNKITYILFFLLSVVTMSAQVTNDIQEPEMADLFRSEGKIYVVIAVLAITFTCLIGYLIYIDIKVRKLEKIKK